MQSRTKVRRATEKTNSIPHILQALLSKVWRFFGGLLRFLLAQFSTLLLFVHFAGFRVDGGVLLEILVGSRAFLLFQSGAALGCGSRGCQLLVEMRTKIGSHAMLASDSRDFEVFSTAQKTRLFHLPPN